MTETRSTYEELCRVMCIMARELEEARSIRIDDSQRNEELKAKVKDLEAEVVTLKVAIKDWCESAEIGRAEVKEANAEAAELRCRLDDAERDSGLIRAHESVPIAKALETLREAKEKDVATFHVEKDKEKEEPIFIPDPPEEPRI